MILQVGSPTPNAEAAPMEMTPLALTITQAVTVSGIGRTMIFELIKTGKLKARKVGRRTLIATSDLREMIDNLPLREGSN